MVHHGRIIFVYEDLLCLYCACSTFQNILNHCFDDIEKFVGRLQLVAEARKELDRRKKTRGKKSKKNHGGTNIFRLSG